MKPKNNLHKLIQKRNDIYQNIKISEQQIKEKKVKDAFSSLEKLRQKYNIY